MRTDHERAWGLLRDLLVTKRSHGQAELLRSMVEIEQQCRLEHGEIERFARVYGDDLLDAFQNVTHAARQPLTNGADRPDVMPATPHLPTTNGDAPDDHAGHSHGADRRAVELHT